MANATQLVLATLSTWHDVHYALTTYSLPSTISSSFIIIIIKNCCVAYFAATLIFLFSIVCYYYSDYYYHVQKKKLAWVVRLLHKTSCIHLAPQHGCCIVVLVLTFHWNSFDLHFYFTFIMIIIITTVISVTEHYVTSTCVSNHRLYYYFTQSLCVVHLITTSHVCLYW